MKRLFLLLVFIFSAAFCFAGHIAGGEVFYKYLGAGSPGSSQYEISVRLFRECNPPASGNGAQTADMPTTVYLSIYNNASPATLVQEQIAVSRATFEILSLGAPNPCITPRPNICYQVGVFKIVKELPNTTAGYIVTFQTCCRTSQLVNIVQPDANGQSEGSTYTAQIPGTDALPTGNNSSPEFNLRDTTVVCASSPFVLDFGANDPDATDSLSYSFCAAYNRGITTAAADTKYSAPPYNNVSYQPSFGGYAPLGENVVINSKTGIISGVAPGTPGRYVVSVCINEWRAGKIISSHRKDFTLIVSSCSLTGAALKPSYVTCTGTTLFFQNESTSSSVASYLWDFGVQGITTDTSTQPTPSYDYLQAGKDSGTYQVKLKVATTNGCQDSATAVVKVYPGFKTGFTVTGACVLKDYIFSDTSTIKYGTITRRLWDFGDASSLADTARAKDTAWRYASAGQVTQRLIVENSVGCIDTISKPFTVLDKPALSLPFRDTLICSIDTLMLRSDVVSGTVTWKAAGTGPNVSRIQNAGTATPLVWPNDTTRYYVTVNDNGCNNTDSVTVNVLQFISVDAGLDTNICRTDTFHLRPTSYALQYLWTASSGEAVQNIKNPLVQPLVNTKYIVIANLGKCQAKDSVLVNVSPYPVVDAGPDVTICYGQRTTLNAATNGSQFTWTPTASLIRENTLTPVAGPTKTTAYILTSSNTTGCLKEKKDTIIVTVTPAVSAYAGRDTAVVAGQPLQLQASGGDTYTWTPSTWLDNPLIYNPVATPDATMDSIIYTVRASVGACYADDQVKVRVYKSGPDILVPSGFTPNGDGKNDVLRPFLMGISKLNYFSIYNRWGQLLFTTTEENKAWDGSFSGVPQPSGAYVYQTAGVDFLGKVVFRKGTVVLIR